MKIGVITLPLSANYGGILQAYALQKILNNMGHDAYLISKKESAFIKITKLMFRYLQNISYYIKLHITPVELLKKDENDQKIILQNTNEFIKKYIRCVYIKNNSELKENDFNAFIVGSDQIWRPKYFGSKNVLKIFYTYLSFAYNWDVKRISYAASFGTDEWEYNKIQTYICKILIHKFNAVSVREDSGVDLCNKFYHIDASLMIDPTMLLNREDYINLFLQSNTPKSSGSLLCYILDENQEKTNMIESLSQKLNLIPFRVNSKIEEPSAPINKKIQPSIEQWLRGFYDAEFVVTDSFHACVFSILFRKPFVVYGNKDRGLSRFTSLLNMFGLNDRLVTDLKDLNKCEFKNIDWDNVYSRLSAQRKKSFDFIKLALK